METRVFALASQITPDILNYILSFTSKSNCNFAKIFSPMRTESDEDMINFRQVVNGSHEELMGMLANMYPEHSHPMPYMAAATYLHDGINATFNYNHFQLQNGQLKSMGLVESNKSILESLKDNDLSIFRGGAATDFTNLSLLLKKEFIKKNNSFMDYFLQGNGHYLAESLNALYLTKSAQSIDHLFATRRKIQTSRGPNFRLTGDYRTIKVNQLERDLQNFVFSPDPNASIGKYLSDRRQQDVVYFDNVGPMLPSLCNVNYEGKKQIRVTTVPTSDIFDREDNRKKSVLVYGSPFFENCNIVLRVHGFFKQEMYPKVIQGDKIYRPNVHERDHLNKFHFQPTVQRLSAQEGLAMINLKDGMAICIEAKGNDFTGDAYIYNPHRRKLEAYVHGKVLSGKQRSAQFIPLDLDPYQMRINSIGDGL